MTDELDRLRQTVAELSRRLGLVEDIAAIRRLHHAYGYFMDYCRFDDVIELFAADGEAVFLSGVYRGHASLRRLYVDFLGQTYTRGSSGPLDGFLIDHLLAQDLITVAPNGGSAKGRFRALLMLGSHESRRDTPPELPRQLYEAGLYENDYVRENGVWKIKRLEYALQWQADYAKGWAHTATDLPPALTPFPENRLGPDERLPQTRGVWPRRTPLDFHYVHPVTGQPVNSAPPPL